MIQYNRDIYYYLLNVTEAAFSIFFFFNDTATTEIYTLSLHDALPILAIRIVNGDVPAVLKDKRIIGLDMGALIAGAQYQDRKSTRLNSSHSQISYAVFCLKKKKNQQRLHPADIVYTNSDPTQRSINLS